MIIANRVRSRLQVSPYGVYQGSASHKISILAHNERKRSGRFLTHTRTLSIQARLKPSGLLCKDIAMHNTKDMGRVLYRHDWTDLQEWATALVELGDLSDDEIAELVADQNAAPPYVS